MHLRRGIRKKYMDLLKKYNLGQFELDDFFSRFKPLIQENIKLLGLLHEDYNLLMIASHEGNLELVKYLVEEKSSDVNLITSRGDALHFASLGNQLEIVRYLVSKDINISVKDSKGKTALDWSEEVREYLINELIRQNILEY